MWEDESSEPQLVVQYAESGYRLVDNLSVAGSVDDGTAVIYGARGSTPTLLRWPMVEDPENEGEWVFTSEPVINELSNIPTGAWGTPGWAAPKGPGIDAPFLAGGRSTTAIRDYAADATTTGYLEVPGNRNIGSAHYLAGGESEFIVAYHPTVRNARIHEIGGEPGGVWTNRTGEDYGFTPVIGPTVENTYGDVASRVNADGTVTLFVLGTSNGIGAYTTTEALFEPVQQVLTVAEARAEGSGATVTFEAVIGRTMGAFTYLQDETAGITIRETSGSFKDAVDDGTLQPGTRVRVTGELSEYNHLLQINQDDLDEWEILGQEESPEPALITLQDLVDNGEQYEGMVVRVENLVTSSSDETFAAAKSYVVSDETTEEGIVELRVPNESDTEVVGVAVPQVAFAFEGAVGQFSFDEPNSGYQLMAIQAADIIVPEPVPVLEDPLWVINAGDVPWFANDNATRGGDYNPATDNLLVPSRTGQAQVQILHPATGQALGMLDMTNVEGGTFVINEVSVTADGQIFVANLAQLGGDLKIYRWADQQATPEVVYEGQPLEGARYGDALHASADGDDVLVFVSGTGTHNIAMITLSDGDADVELIELDDDIARAGIFRVPGQDSLWVNGAGTDLTKIAFDGTVGRVVGPDVLSTAYGDIYHFNWRDRSYILTGPQYQADHRFLVVDVTDAGEERVVYETIGLGETPNANAVGFVTADWKRGNLIVGATNNAIASFSLEERENTAPQAGGIAIPLNNAEITIEGDSDQMLTIVWRHGIDAEGDPVLHTWQLSTSNDFGTLVFEDATLNDTTTAVSYEDLAAFLDDQGITGGESLTVYHRVLVSDGELSRASAVSTLTLTRGTMTNIDPRSDLPREFALQGNYPNPFNPTTNIRFDLPEAADVSVEIFDILGRKVMELNMNAVQAGANQNIRVDASALASGTYLYRVVAEMASQTRSETGKMVLVK